MEFHPIRISCVSYLNSIPFVYGIKHHAISSKIALSLDIPSVCAEKLSTGRADIGLVPVAAISTINGATPISNWCIGADGDVKSVTLLSEVPLDKIETILLDYHSVTSINLTRVLAGFYWKINPLWVNAQSGFEQTISGTTAAVVIGDRSLQMRDKFNYVYDLAGEWKKFTGKPFVFACWVSNKILGSNFLEDFNNALAYGINHIDEVVAELKVAPNYFAGTEEYLKNYLHYAFTDEMKSGMELFLNYKNQLSGTVFNEQL